MRKLGWFGLFLFLLSFVITVNSARAQNTASPAATQEIALLQHALWGAVPAHQVELSGTATQYAGSDVEQGTINLTATSAGTSIVDLSLGNAERKVTATALNANRECEWSKNGVMHQTDYMNCLKPLVWFLPGMTLQSGIMPTSIGINNLGPVHIDGALFTRIQAETVMSGLDTALLKESMTRSSMDLDLNPKTMLPARLRYSLLPDDGSSTTIQIEIRYSDYRKYRNAEIPYHIQRYVNGSLQLDIQINSVSFS